MSRRPERRSTRLHVRSGDLRAAPAARRNQPRKQKQQQRQWLKKGRHVVPLPHCQHHHTRHFAGALNSVGQNCLSALTLISALTLLAHSQHSYLCTCRYDVDAHSEESVTDASKERQDHQKRQVRHGCVQCRGAMIHLGTVCVSWGSMSVPGQCECPQIV